MSVGYEQNSLGVFIPSKRFSLSISGASHKLFKRLVAEIIRHLNGRIGMQINFKVLRTGSYQLAYKIKGYAVSCTAYPIDLVMYPDYFSPTATTISQGPTKDPLISNFFRAVSISSQTESFSFGDSALII